jgi:hypothetical protein
MTQADQLTTLRELVRDAIEVARTAAAERPPSAWTDAFERARTALAAILTELDDVATSTR